MGTRIQPRDIEVLEDDPFKHDLLDRKESVEVLSHLVASFEGPCVLAVDAPWGNGKTTFLKIWAQYLRNQNFPVIEFNAWETDFTGDPFVALSTELIDALEGNADTSMRKKISNTKECAKNILLKAAPGIIRIATSGVLDISPLFEKEIGDVLASQVEERISSYIEAKTSVKDFRNTLQDTASALSGLFNNQPLIVMIDELDRCRPSYAVELLEVAKHLFSVDHIVFVLAINRSQLSHSISGVYGADFDATDYLRRFFDIDFRLPEPDKKQFVDAALTTIGIEGYFGRTRDIPARGHAEMLREMLRVFFGASDLSLRRIAQATHRLGLVFGSLRSDELAFTGAAAVALILRTIDVDLYHRFTRGDVSDLEVIENVYDRLDARSIRSENEGELFEALVILAFKELTSSRKTRWPDANSPLLQSYQELVEQNPAR